MAELDAFGKAVKGFAVTTTLDADGSSVIALDGVQNWHPKLRLSASETQAVVHVLTTKKEEPPVEEPPIEPPPSTDIIWAADGEKGGPTNNPFLEWAAYVGAGWNEGNKHGRINLVKAMDSEHGGTSARRGTYMYRYELKPGRNEWDNERLELSNNAQAQSGAKVPQGLAEAKMAEWHEGQEFWIAHDVYFPTVPNNEVTNSENTYGVIPIAQFHPQASPPPPWGLAVLGTRPGKTPVLWKPGTNLPEWRDKQTFKAATWYRFIWHVHISSSSSAGFVEGWVARGATAPFEQIINMHGTTLVNSYTYPCLGGPRNEASTGSSVPPTTIWYTGGMIFTKTKAAAESVL